MNSRKGKRYDQQFKEDALATLSHSGRPLSQIARDLGIAEVTLWKWKQQYRAALGPAKTADGHPLPASELAKENQQLRRGLERLRTHHEILKSLGHTFGAEPAEKYALIQSMSAEFTIQPLCVFFGVSRSGFYAWCQGQGTPCQRHLANQKLTQRIRQIYGDHRGVYGSPKITRALREEGLPCGRNRVARLMRLAGLRGVQGKAFVPRTTGRNHHNPVAPNRLAQLPGPPTELNEVWVTDITYLPSHEGWLYLAAIMDLASRKIIGWHLENHLQTSLPLQALQRAVSERRPAAPGDPSF
jgi:transposase-like protein